MIGIINSEVNALRQQAGEVIAKAQAEKDALEAKAAKLEQQAQTMPGELAQLPEDVALRAWDWIKSLF